MQLRAICICKWTKEKRKKSFELTKLDTLDENPQSGSNDINIQADYKMFSLVV